MACEAKSEVVELFDCLQLRIKVRGGSEAVIHSSKITYDKTVGGQSDEVVLQIDFKNAFNSVKRSQ